MTFNIRIEMVDGSIWEMPIFCVVSHCANLFQLNFNSYSESFEYYENLFKDDSKNIVIHYIEHYMQWSDVKDYITLVQDNKSFPEMWKTSKKSVYEKSSEERK
jgi:hypothetical protein